MAALFKAIAETLARCEARVAAAWASAAHRHLMLVQWGLKPHPEHFDHHIDLFHQWLKTRNAAWLERGVYGALALKGGDVLELSCGDGFNARNFYSLRSRRIVACDIDADAIATARRKNGADNIEYVQADIRTAMPDGRFDNVVWDFAFPLVRYFTSDEIAAILRNIKRRLPSEGVLSGYTEAERDGQFRQLADLRAFLAPHFANVRVFETYSPGRHNLYFWASDGPVPFQDGWQAAS